VAATNTRDRVLDAALGSFGTRGYEATSLDAIAASLGVRKQTILYYFPAKEALLEAVIDRSAAELSHALERALARAGPGFARVEAVVRSVFRVAVRRPALLGLLREVSRLGPPATTRLTEGLEPLLARATGFLEAEMAAGAMRGQDARLLLLNAYSLVIGAATEVEVLRALGYEPTAASLLRRRAELLDFLRSALVASAPPSARLVDGGTPEVTNRTNAEG
jgi:AcrR family transcriptional regulator